MNVLMYQCNIALTNLLLPNQNRLYMETFAKQTNKTFTSIRISTNTQLEIISAVFILLFIYTGISKLIDVHAFQGAMRKSKPLAHYAKILSYAVPIIEIIIAVLLAVPNRIKKIGMWASLGMMFIFTAYVIYILEKFEGHLPCTCGGIISKLTWKQHLILNFILLLIALRGLLLMRKQSKLNKINQ